MTEIDKIIVGALVAAYRNALNDKIYGPDAQTGHRNGVRDVAVRLGLYAQFNAVLNEDGL